ncbi:MAG: phytoene/squalene synthase family protein [Bosea sp. (in: a-proteobacteria)]
MRQNWPDSTSADLASCNRLLRAGSKSFYAASLLLPGEVRSPATALYAFCRLADDAIDDGPGDPATVERLRRRVEDAYAGRPHDHPADRAFSAVVRRFALPAAVPLALIEGFAWDAEGRRYESFADLCDYAARVAGTVGVMMATVMERRSPEVLARAADLGVAMQLTNIARDIGEDARRGRLYLPLAWLREEGIAPEALLANPVSSPQLARLVARLLDEAERLYRRADAGIDRLPGGCRAGIRAARLIYAEIGHEVIRAGCDSVSRRAVVGKRRKFALLARALMPVLADAQRLALPPLPANAALVAAVAMLPHPARPALRIGGVPWWNFTGRATAVIDMFERLGRIERTAVRGP